MEVYIDDMLVKSVKSKLHIAHLAESFQVLKNYNMKLNPTKCAFGVSTRKFLGFMVNSREIEENPDKIKSVLDMHPPSNTKEIQRLTGRICETPENSNFMKKSKIVILVKIQNFSKSRMMKRTSSLESSHEI